MVVRPLVPFVFLYASGLNLMNTIFLSIPILLWISCIRASWSFSSYDLCWSTSTANSVPPISV